MDEESPLNSVGDGKGAVDVPSDGRDVRRRERRREEKKKRQRRRKR